mmetsp:Transcript_28713/g.93784  ORF Transcript_28713/g.93784 Transcript_28713/m.93784 type:complete len:135 (-) Transcript_28713:549-953(-)|eukprot:CAMPEP_0170162094 /NCGR_PEP_ID=MMETSP0033_2-20121228/76924_1 /TAXON_ID=195969 /ORGANISM="Dolichomastix tenuilepis, Strain CCMP3274" /LENGTH=134 /DNA_ID=CAMNT_0010399719 /DNA_START=60 /DNA_END=464 /DNA_ORIENTATION=+
MAQAKRKPVFVKVDALRPGTQGHNVVVKVVDAKMITQNRARPDGSSAKLAECTVGDETGVVIFTARGAQVDLMVPGKVLNVRNAKIDMFKGTMRLVVDKWGLVQAADESVEIEGDVKTDNNLSLVEYELVTVTD